MMKRLLPLHVLVCVCLALNCYANVSFGGPTIGPPPGLVPGDTFQWVFVTSTVRDSRSGTIKDYDQFVQEAANNSPLVVSGVQGVTSLADITWKAIASTYDSAARYTLGTFAPYIFRLDGVRVADDQQGPYYEVLWNGWLLNPINITETLQPRLTIVWTGSYHDGTPREPLGGSWNSVGTSSSTDTRWIDNYHELDYKEYSLYGISAHLTVADPKVIPEPGSLFLALTGALSCALVRYRKRSKNQASDTAP